MLFLLTMPITGITIKQANMKRPLQKSMVVIKGLLLRHIYVTVVNSRFINLKSFAIENTGTSKITAINNYWDTTSPAGVAAKIWDFNDDIQKGEVLYSPFLMSPTIVTCITAQPILRMLQQPQCLEIDFQVLELPHRIMI